MGETKKMGEAGFFTSYTRLAGVMGERFEAVSPPEISGQAIKKSM